MFLGTPRRWWLAAAVLFLAALLLIGTDTGGTLGNIVGILLLFASIGVFGMSPMRYGRRSRESTTGGENLAAHTGPPAASQPPAPRPAIDARDPWDV